MSEDAVLTATNMQTRAMPTRAPARRRWLPPLVIVLCLALFWEAVKFLFQLSDQKLPHLTSIFAQFGMRTQGGNGPLLGVTMLLNGAATFSVALLGFALGALLGCGLAVLFSASSLLERGLLPYVIGSQTVPILAIAPMVVVGLGKLGAPEWLPKAVVAAYLTFFPVTVGMLRGLRATSPDALALMRSYAASPTQTFFKLRFPAALPYLFTSLKIAATASVVGAIVAELPSGSKSGIGIAILNASQYYNSRPPLLYATVIVAGLVGLIFYGIVVLAEQIFVPQRRTEAGE